MIPCHALLRILQTLLQKIRSGDINEIRASEWKAPPVYKGFHLLLWNKPAFSKGGRKNLFKPWTAHDGSTVRPAYKSPRCQDREVHIIRKCEEGFGWIQRLPSHPLQPCCRRPLLYIKKETYWGLMTLGFKLQSSHTFLVVCGKSQKWDWVTWSLNYWGKSLPCSLQTRYSSRFKCFTTWSFDSVINVIINATPTAFGLLFFNIYLYTCNIMIL